MSRIGGEHFGFFTMIAGYFLMFLFIGVPIIYFLTKNGVDSGISTALGFIASMVVGTFMLRFIFKGRTLP